MPYSTIRPSGCAWLGNIPSHWGTRRIGGLFTQRNEFGYPGLPILEVSIKTGVRVRNMDGTGRKQVMSDQGKYKFARRGDIAYNTMRMWQGAVGVTPTDGLISPAYVVARPSDGVMSGYYASLFRTPVFMKEVIDWSRGIVLDRNRLYWDQFKQIAVPAISQNEQIAIVRYLSNAVRQIDHWIGAQKKIRELLLEQRNTKLSALLGAGLGDLQPLRLSQLVYFSNAGEVIDKSWWGNGPELLYTCARQPLKSDFKTFQDRKRTSDRDLLLTRNATPYVHIPLPNSIYSNVVQRIRLRPGYDREYIAAALQHVARSMRGYGVSIESLNYEMWKVLKVPVPEERRQRDVVTAVKAVESECAQRSKPVAELIDQLREYRTRFIADIVTGKLDVRTAAAALPADTDEPAPILDADGDEADVDEDADA